jgi:hypothetical protein
MSSTKKVASKTTTTKAPTKADTLRALKFLRKTAMEMHTYSGKAYTAQETKRKSHLAEDTKRRLGFMEKLPAEAFHNLAVQAAKKGKNYLHLDEALEALGYEPLPVPPTARDLRDELVKEIDTAIYSTMLGDFDSGIVAKFAKTLEAFK